MKTLVVRLDHLGDLLLTTPLVRALALGGHTVDLLVKRDLALIFDHSPYVHECFGIENVAPAFPRNWWQLARWLRTRRYDNIVLAHAGEKRLCLASAFSGAKRRIAMWGGLWGRLTFHQCLRSEILTHPRPFSEILLDCATALAVPAHGLKPDLFLTNSEKGETAAMMPARLRDRRIVGIHPATAGNTCNLPTKVYGEIARLLLDETDVAIILTGTKDEQKLIEEWPRHVTTSERVWLSFGELSIRQLACVIEHMSVYVCPSTGPLHVASAVGAKTVSPFCPTTPLCATIWGNVGAAARVLEPATCLRESAGPCCDFRGQITAVQILHAVVSVLQLATTQSESAGLKSS